MTERQRVSSGTVWEERVGYCRAMRIGNMVVVAGTTATGEDGKTVGVGDVGEQTRYILRKIETALHSLGAQFSDVVRYRAYMLDIGELEKIVKPLHTAFGDVRPVSTVIEISKLVSPDHLIEIEVDAIVGD